MALKLAICLPYVIRLVIVSGCVALVIAYTHATRIVAPEWIREPVIQSCASVGMPLIPFYVGAEIFMYFCRGNATRLWLLIVAGASVSSAWLYVLPASLHAIDLAQWDTWHLLPLFAVMYMVINVAIFGGMGVVVILIAMSVINRNHARKVSGLSPQPTRP